tara:strand:- start:17 stop:613 length:597 start_codon:yes stop_codon:yes gene_type:complete
MNKELFRDLNEAEEKEFRQWARDNYKAGDPIDTVWHPVVQDECKKMKYNRMWGKWMKEHIDDLFTNEYAHPISDLQPNIIAMFKAWYPSNMHIVSEFYKWSVHLRTHGKRENYSSQMIVHRIRWETALNSEFDNFKLNQNLGSALGRVVMKLDPQLKGMFRTKSVRCPAMSEDLPMTEDRLLRFCDTNTDNIFDKFKI